jgi:subtilisin family serine protease
MKNCVRLLVICAISTALVNGQTPQGLALTLNGQTPQDASLTIQQDSPKLLRRGPRAIPNQYIVVLDQDATGVAGDIAAAAKRADNLLQGFGRMPTYVYGSAINGFAVELTEGEAVALSQDPRVLFVEEDSVMEAVATQNNPPWGLDRIDQRDRPLSATYSYTTTGAGVNVYIIDTGIRRTHTQFGGRAFSGFSAINDGRGTNDCHGHGTHVAGTVGGSTYGVAKGVRLFAVRVLSCGGSGSTSGVIAGVDWVTANHVEPAVANMSLGGGISNALDTAVRNSIAAGVTYSIAAGNSSINASNTSPARVSEAITVGSSTSSDARSSFSNYGSVVDIFAPGSSILSAWYTNNSASRTLSGTSMAAPHVAGVAARYLQSTPNASPAQVRNEIVNNATTNRLSGIPSGTANRLLFWSGTR